MSFRNDGWRVNAKRIYRLWRPDGLKSPENKQKRWRLRSSPGGILGRKAEHKNHVWSVDFIFDRTPNGRSLKTLVVIDARHLLRIGRELIDGKTAVALPASPRFQLGKESRGG
ncbi:hypothetical protein N9D23_01995 [Rubripirellula sp.]|nr:hypothetical protein [Rubripirellula sp.]